jgi:PPM family protein phosphatase
MYRGLQLRSSGEATGVARAYSPISENMDVEFTELSDRGRVREGNEDYFGHMVPSTPERVRSHGWLFALADGVGGHDLGEVASRTAIESMLSGFRESSGSEMHPALLSRLVQTANRSVVDAGHESTMSGSSMATTLVSCALRFDRATVAHVGDSRCYLIRRGQAAVLTRDHTVVNDQARLGLLSAEEASASANKHLLSRCLGAGLFVNVDVNEHQVLVGDVLVLCSDGLHGAVSGTEIAAICGNGGDLARSAQRLVDIANQRDGSDNITLQIIRVRSVERVGMYRGRPYRLP